MRQLHVTVVVVILHVCGVQASSVAGADAASVGSSASSTSSSSAGPPAQAAVLVPVSASASAHAHLVESLPGNGDHATIVQVMEMNTQQPDDAADRSIGSGGGTAGTTQMAPGRSGRRSELNAAVKAVQGWAGPSESIEVESSVVAPDKPGPHIIQVPLTWQNGAAVLVLLGLAVLGAVYVYKLGTQATCACKLCTGAYVIQNRLGSGGFGSVYEVTRASDGHRYVLKKVPVEDINDANDAQAEAKELRSLRHPRIVGYEDDFLHTTTVSAGSDAHLFVCIVMELCERDLRRKLEAQRADQAPFPEDQLLKYLAQLCTALRYCHSHSIIHRDIKPQNVFLDQSDNCRLGDFGLCRQVDKPFTSYTEADKSPETILGGRRDGRKSDIWSLGLLMHELMTLTLAWERPESIGALMLKRPAALDDFVKQLPKAYSPQLRKLVRKLMAVDPAERPTADEVLRLKFVRRFAMQDAKRHKPRSPRTPATGGESDDQDGGSRSGSDVESFPGQDQPLWTGTGPGFSIPMAMPVLVASTPASANNSDDDPAVATDDSDTTTTTTTTTDTDTESEDQVSEPRPQVSLPDGDWAHGGALDHAPPPRTPPTPDAPTPAGSTSAAMQRLRRTQSGSTHGDAELVAADDSSDSGDTPPGRRRHWLKRAAHPPKRRQRKGR